MLSTTNLASAEAVQSVKASLSGIDKRLDELLAQTLRDGPSPMTEEELDAFNELTLEKIDIYNRAF